MSRLKNLTLALVATYGDAADLERAQREAAEIIADKKRAYAAEWQRNKRRADGAIPRQPRPMTELRARAEALGFDAKTLAAELGCTPTAVRLAFAGDTVPGVRARLVALLDAREGAK